MSEKGTNALHSITPVEIHFNGEKALSESTGSIRCRYDVDGEPYICFSSLRFVSQLKKTQDGWRLLTLDVIYEMDQMAPMAPSGHQQDCTPPSHLRKSYACVSWLLAQQGYIMNQELAGTDQAESVEGLMKAGFKWLNQA